MTFKDYSRFFMKSPLGIGCVALGVLAFLLLFLGIGTPLLPSVLAGLGVSSLIAVSALLSGAGSALALGQKEGADRLSAARAMEKAAESRDRIAALRFADPDIRRVAELVALAAGEFIDACRAASTREPRGEEAVESALEALSIYQKEADEASTEKRFGLPDADPFADAKARTIALVEEKAALLRESRIAVSGGLSAAYLMDVKEELK